MKKHFNRLHAFLRLACALQIGAPAMAAEMGSGQKMQPETHAREENQGILNTFGRVRDMVYAGGDVWAYSFQHSPSTSVFIAYSPNDKSRFGHLFNAAQANVGALAYNPVTGRVLAGSDLPSNRLLDFNLEQMKSLRTIQKNVPTIAHSQLSNSTPYINNNDQIWLLRKVSSAAFSAGLYKQNTDGTITALAGISNVPLGIRTALAHNRDFIAMGYTYKDASDPPRNRTDISRLLYTGSISLMRSPGWIYTDDDTITSNIIAIPYHPAQNPYSDTDTSGYDWIVGTEGGRIAILAPSVGGVPEARVIDIGSQKDIGAITSLHYAKIGEYEGIFYATDKSLDIGFVPYVANGPRMTPALCVEAEEAATSVEVLLDRTQVDTYACAGKQTCPGESACDHAELPLQTRKCPACREMTPEEAKECRLAPRHLTIPSLPPTVRMIYKRDAEKNLIHYHKYDVWDRAVISDGSEGFQKILVAEKDGQPNIRALSTQSNAVVRVQGPFVSVPLAPDPDEQEEALFRVAAAQAAGMDVQQARVRRFRDGAFVAQPGPSVEKVDHQPFYKGLPQYNKPHVYE